MSDPRTAISSAAQRLKRDQNLRTRYGIGLDDYEKLLAYQGGVCAICGGPPDTRDRVFAVDHDHATGRVRGLLCKGCNTAMGHLKDNPDNASRVQLYLETHKPTPILPVEAALVPQSTAVLSAEGSAAGSEATAKDPRIPTPEVIAALKGHGLTFQEIADEFELSLRQTKRLYTDAERSTRAEFARDWLFKEALPSSLVTLRDAVRDGDAKTALALVKGLGALREAAPETAPVSGASRTFEEWRATITRTTVTSAVDPTAESVAATSVVSVSAPVAAAVEARVLPGGDGPLPGAGTAPESPPTPFPVPFDRKAVDS